jgi:ubiquinone biosynthesis protein
MRRGFLDLVARLSEVSRVFGRQGWRYFRRRARGEPTEGPLLLREALEQLSGCFVKFGQILALQVDSLPQEYCDALMSLLDRVPPIPTEGVEQTFLEDLGESPRTLFREFDYIALASASIGEVHRATLKNGAKVAVKVQRPGIRPVFERDVMILQAMVAVILFFRLRWLYFMRDLVGELSTWTRDELDYRREAAYCKLLAENAVHTPTERVPNVHWDLTTRRILTMDFLEGPSVASYLRALEEHDEASLAALKKLGFDPGKFSTSVVSNFLSDAFSHGVFHADLHPANLIILPDNVVGYVDFGIVATLTPEARRKQVELTMAYASGSADAIYREFLNICTIGPDADLPGLRARISALTREWYTEPPVAGAIRFRVKITRTMMDLLNVCRHYGVSVDREMIKYIRSTVLADGLISRLRPGFDLASILRRVVEGYIVEENRKKIFSTAGALSLLTDLTVWLEAGPSDFLHALDMLERRELRMSGVMKFDPDRNEGLRARAVYVGAVWVVSVLSLIFGGGFPSFRTAPFLAVLAITFVILWGLWLTRLLRRLWAR